MGLLSREYRFNPCLAYKSSSNLASDFMSSLEVTMSEGEDGQIC
jgi:hypothetical protein